MANDMHEVVTLLLARMESHPEEFARGMSRWGWMLEGVLTHCSEEERAVLKAALRSIHLGQLHEDVMDELLNGPERRAEEQSMGAALNARPHPTKKVVLTQAQMSIINKLTESYTPTEKDKFIRDYARNIREKQK